MDATTSDPDRGEITEAADTTGITLSWPAYKANARRYVSAGYLAIWLVFAALGWFTAAEAVAKRQGNGLFFFWSAFGVVGTALALPHLWRLLRGRTPEFVRLEADRLKYDPGHGPSEARSCAELPDGKVVPVTPAPATEASRTAIRGFGIDRVNGRQRLYFDTDDRRVEIGGCLTEAERAWLFAVLQRWLGKPAAPPWSPAAQRHKEEAHS